MSEGTAVVPVVETPPVVPTPAILQTPTPHVGTTITPNPLVLETQTPTPPAVTTTTPNPPVLETQTPTPPVLTTTTPNVPNGEELDMGDAPCCLAIPMLVVTLTNLSSLRVRANKSQAVADDIRDIRQAVEDLIPVVVTRHNMSIKEIRRRVYNGLVPRFCWIGKSTRHGNMALTQVMDAYHVVAPPKGQGKPGTQVLKVQVETQLPDARRSSQTQLPMWSNVKTCQRPAAKRWPNEEISSFAYHLSQAKRSKVSSYNAQVCWIMESLNEGREFGSRYTMEQAKAMMRDDPSLKDNIDPEDLKRMMAKLEADGVLKRTGVRGDNVAAAVDAQRTLDVIAELIRGLFLRTGILGFAFFSRGNYNDVLEPVSMELGDALGFCSEILGREPELINTMLELWAIQKSSGAITAPTTEKMRSLSSAMIKSGLIQITSKTNIVMNFEGYIKSIIQSKHVALEGWPAGVPWKRVGKLTGAGDVRRVYKALKDGTCKWKKLTEAEEDEEERRLNKLIKKGLAEEANVRKIQDDVGHKHQTQTQGTERQRRARRTETYAESDDDNDEPEPEPESDPEPDPQSDPEPEPSDNEGRPFADYDGDYSDDDEHTQRKKSKSRKPAAKSASKSASKSTTKVTSKSTTKAASKSTTKAASKSTTKAKPTATKAKVNLTTKAKPAATKPKPAATKPKPAATKPKPAKTAFIPTPAPPRVVMKGGKFVPNGAAIAAHEREMIAVRGKHEHENRERGGGSDGEGGEERGVAVPHRQCTLSCLGGTFNCGHSLTTQPQCAHIALYPVTALLNELHPATAGQNSCQQAELNPRPPG
ncbi:hypothetical protein FB45DRAFT_859303 [Roridomyces roridus]|uniref:Uncharacterized protein n=1 Tax=Roridomyces roridus TaxID=1738132 RepID=A0AAD7CJI9_9AGAR|nr:hypothetical protein FB45DRAFT_859303 [Roridomyces roridus]